MTEDQIKKGLIITISFVILRLMVARLWNSWFGMEYHLTFAFLLFLFVSFLVISLGLVYLGFTHWVGVDLRAWWLRPGQIAGDIKWGIGSIALGGLLFLGVMLGLYFLNLIPPSLMATPQQDASIGQGMAPLPINLLLGWFFGFAIAAFTEETIFRGFLMRLLVEKVTPRSGNVLQAALFSISHLGMAPLGAFGYEIFSLLFRFASGLLFGWLAKKRGTLLASGIVHGFIG
ncbi:MAG TPA: CPBP family intramembrane metalloprotease [bacterium]|nr:CPBP family intramembrane metalloprotease [bacterium]